MQNLIIKNQNVMILSIFSGMDTLFFLLGIVTTLAVVGLIMFNKQNKLNWKSWTSFILGFIILVFAIAWAVSSMIEGEPRSASMGLTIFGIPALLLLVFGWRITNKAK